jgi:hypothetical protein
MRAVKLNWADGRHTKTFVRDGVAPTRINENELNENGERVHYSFQIRPGQRRAKDIELEYDQVTRRES